MAETVVGCVNRRCLLRKTAPVTSLARYRSFRDILVLFFYFSVETTCSLKREKKVGERKKNIDFTAIAKKLTIPICSVQ